MTEEPTTTEPTLALFAVTDEPVTANKADFAMAPNLPEPHEKETPSDVRLPNVTLPCPNGIQVNLGSFSRKERFQVVYVYGEYNIQDNTLILLPTMPGEQEVELTYLQDGRRRSIWYRFLVNQDPKKLWEEHNPPNDALFPKDLAAMGAYQDERVSFLFASRRGRSHAQSGTFRDDDCAFRCDKERGIYVLVVADGAGSAKYSREGARRAVTECAENLARTLFRENVWASDDETETSDGLVAQLLVRGAYYAFSRLSDLCRENNASFGTTERFALKDFNTTLLVAAAKVACDGSWHIVSFSIGDGAIAWVSPGASTLLCSPDGGEYSGQTSFLTSTSVWPTEESSWPTFRQTRIHTTRIPPEIAHSGFLALMTDGVSDPFFETDVALNDPARWDTFVLRAVDVDKGPKTLNEILRTPTPEPSKLFDWLAFWSRGNHDDRTLALLMPAHHMGKYFA